MIRSRRARSQRLIAFKHRRVENYSPTLLYISLKEGYERGI